MIRLLPLLPFAFLAACSGEGDDTSQAPPEAAEAPAAAPARRETRPLDPPAPGEPGGLPDDGTPLSEAPFGPDSAQGAANVLQTYYALIERGEYEEAWALRSPGSNGPTPAEFAASFDDYAEYHAQVGAPSEISGAAGSLYVEVPVQIYGRLKDGKPFSSAGTVTLRRSNAVPGSTAAQRRWRIYTSG